MFDSGYSNMLTNREMEVLRLMADGCSNKQIARKLDITIRTVKFHTANVYTKIKVNSRCEAIAWVWKNRELTQS